MEMRKSRKLILRVIELFKRHETRHYAIKLYNIVEPLERIDELSDEFNTLREEIMLVMSSDNV